MYYKELMDGWEEKWSRTNPSATRVFRENPSEGDVSLPELGDAYSRDSSGFGATIEVTEITKAYPDDNYAEYTVTYTDPSSTSTARNTISLDEQDSERFDVRPEMITIGNEDTSGYRFSNDNPCNQSLARVILVGDWSTTFTTSDKTDAYNHAAQLGSVLDSNEHWLFAGISLEQGTNSSGSTTYRITRTYEYKNLGTGDSSAGGKGWNHSWDTIAGDWVRITSPRTLYPTAATFPDTMPFT